MRIKRRTLLVAGCVLTIQNIPRCLAQQSDGADAAAEYERRLAEHQAARSAFEMQAALYWQGIADKRTARRQKARSGEQPSLDDYVLTQPPKYAGPPKPADPQQPEPAITVRQIPVVADFLKSASDEFGFVLQRPRQEIEFKQAYAQTARRAGLTREQIVRIYAFESGGNATYDVQAGLESLRLDARAISTALGYNQLLATNSVELLAEKGDQFVGELQKSSLLRNGPTTGPPATTIEVLMRMIAFARSVPDDWSEHERLGAQPKGLGIHALNLDLWVGPLLQTQKLLDSVVFAKRRSFPRPLTAAELEMMNLTGDGNGLDMISLPQEAREQVPTSNFFQRGGYERNPVAERNPTVARLIAATEAVMDREAVLAGAKSLAQAYDRADQRAQ